MRISDWSSDVCSSDLTVPKPSPTGSSTSWPAPPRRSTPAKPHPRRPSLFRDAALIAGKDLRIELRSQVTTQQVAPFSILVLILFAVALDPYRGFRPLSSAWLFWVAVPFSALPSFPRACTRE